MARDCSGILNTKFVMDVSRPTTLRILLVGKTGSGKSSLGNAILGKELFHPSAYLSAPTSRCEWRKADSNGLTIEVTDTPGILDSCRDTDEVKKEIAKAISCMSPGPHAILFVLRGDTRFTSADYFVFEDLKSLFKDDMTKYLILVLIGISQEQFAEERKNKRIPAQLIRIMHEAGGRVVCVTDTRRKTPTRDVEIMKLLRCVINLRRQNEGNSFYSNKSFETVHEILSEISDQHKLKMNDIKKNLVDETDHGLLARLVVPVSNSVCALM